MSALHHYRVTLSRYLTTPRLLPALVLPPLMVTPWLLHVAGAPAWRATGEPESPLFLFLASGAALVPLLVRAVDGTPRLPLPTLPLSRGRRALAESLALLTPLLLGLLLARPWVPGPAVVQLMGWLLPACLWQALLPHHEDPRTVGHLLLLGLWLGARALGLVDHTAGALLTGGALSALVWRFPPHPGRSFQWRLRLPRVGQRAARPDQLWRDTVRGALLAIGAASAVAALSAGLVLWQGEGDPELWRLLPVWMMLLVGAALFPLDLPAHALRRGLPLLPLHPRDGERAIRLHALIVLGFGLVVCWVMAPAAPDSGTAWALRGLAPALLPTSLGLSRVGPGPRWGRQALAALLFVLALLGSALATALAAPALLLATVATGWLGGRVIAGSSAGDAWSSAPATR